MKFPNKSGLQNAPVTQLFVNLSKLTYLPIADLKSTIVKKSIFLQSTLLEQKCTCGFTTECTRFKELEKKFLIRFSLFKIVTLITLLISRNVFYNFQKASLVCSLRFPLFRFGFLPKQHAYLFCNASGDLIENQVLDCRYSQKH